MSEHRIALRRAWQAVASDAPTRPPWRVDLPTWLEPSWGRVTLTRRFQTPRIDPSRQALALRVERVPGLEAVHIDGAPEALDWQGDVGEAALAVEGRGHTIALSVDAESLAEDQRRDWGRVHIVICDKHSI